MARTPGPVAQQCRRLMIREMVLDNFKSYAGPQSVGPFHKSFSSVVGPNGSGKSNVIDALLFVFGRRAKQLRFNKVSELIHNSTNHQNLEMAKVTVHFQEIIDKEGEEYDVVPGTGFSVARTAHRNNTSDYYINDRRVSAKELTERLKGLGIDLDNNRFLILQGEVEQISMMKPKAEDKNDTGLLEYLEDLIGTHVLVEPIEEANKQLEVLNDRRTHELLPRLKTAAKELEVLDGRKAEAQMFLEKQAEMYQEKVYGTTIYITQTQHHLAQAEGQVKQLEAKLAHEKEKSASHEQNAKDAEQQNEAAEQAVAICQKALDAAEAEFKVFDRKDAKGQIELKDLDNKCKKLTAKMEKDEAAGKKAEAEIVTLQEEVQQKPEHIAGMQQDLSKAEAHLEALHDSLRGEVETYHQQLSKVRSDLAPWEKQLGEVQGTISVASTERDTLARRAEEARKRLDGALKTLAGAQANADARQKRIQELDRSIAKCKKEIEGHKSELSSSRAEEQRLEGDVIQLREKVAALRADAQAGPGAPASSLVTALATATAKKQLQGIIGRLGDLGWIDPKYDVAVSTAVGALDFIVVDTTSNAQRCVEHLRKNSLGVATCLILEKQKHLERAADEKVQTPEGCPRLYDLINKRDNNLRSAFWYACGNTLVAKELEQATRIAYGGDARFARVVTLQGELIAESGTMSGGAGRPARGRMQTSKQATATSAANAQAAAAELQTAQQQLDQVLAALKAARDRVEACEKALRAAEQQLAELEVAASKARMEAQAEADKAADIQQSLDSLKAATQVDAADAARMSELSLSIAREEATATNLKQQMQGLEKQAAALQAKIDNAGGEKLKTAKVKVASLQQSISEAEADLSKKNVQLKACQKVIDKAAKDREKDGKDRTRLQQEQERLRKDLKDMEEQALQVMGLRESTTAELQVKQKELEDARDKLRRVSTELTTIRKTQVEIETVLEQKTKMLKDEGAKIGIWQKDIKAFQAKIKALKESMQVPNQDGDVQMEDAQQEDEPALDPTQLEGQSADEHFYKASVIEAQLEKMSPDLEAIAEWQAKAKEHADRAKALDEVTQERDKVRREYESLRKQRLDGFMAGFNIISMKLKEIYQMITLGGDAELELVDSLDPFSEGIVFSVRPPKKSWKNISNLSGGEKTLSSLSLVFALHHYKPTPLYVMDEIDAALDFKNVSIVAHYIKERTRNAQFIIISLRNNMFELADRLVGIYKTDNTTKTVTINPGHFVVKPAGAAGNQRQSSLADRTNTQHTAGASVAVA